MTRSTPNPLSPAAVVRLRRRLLERLVEENTPRGEVTPPGPTAEGLLTEVLEMRRQYDDALRRQDWAAAQAIKDEARRLLAEEGSR